MMPFASRITDQPSCSIHGGGPILPAGALNVTIGGLPAARATDLAACGQTVDTIVMGSANVLINGLPAARFGDPTAHGGVILGGCATVDIGGPSFSIPFSFEGAPSTIGKIQEGIAILYSTAAGQEIMRRISGAGKTVVVQLTTGGSECEAREPAQVRPGGSGSDSTVRWNPAQTLDLPPSDPRAAAVVLGHELVHAVHNATATHGNGPYESHPGQNGSSSRGEERQTVGSRPPHDASGHEVIDADGKAAGTYVRSPDGTYHPDADYSQNATSENALRSQLGFPARATYYPANWPGGAPW